MERRSKVFVHGGKIDSGVVFIAIVGTKMVIREVSLTPEKKKSAQGVVRR